MEINTKIKQLRYDTVSNVAIRNVTIYSNMEVFFRRNTVTVMDSIAYKIHKGNRLH